LILVSRLDRSHVSDTRGLRPDTRQLCATAGHFCVLAPWPSGQTHVSSGDLIRRRTTGSSASHTVAPDPRLRGVRHIPPSRINQILGSAAAPRHRGHALAMHHMQRQQPIATGRMSTLTCISTASTLGAGLSTCEGEGRRAFATYSRPMSVCTSHVGDHFPR